MNRHRHLSALAPSGRDDDLGVTALHHLLQVPPPFLERLNEDQPRIRECCVQLWRARGHTYVNDRVGPKTMPHVVPKDRRQGTANTMVGTTNFDADLRQGGPQTCLSPVSGACHRT